MNEDAKKEIHRMLEQAFSKYMFVGAQLEPMLVAAMEWAYRDAARICKANNAFAQDILERAK